MGYRLELSKYGKRPRLVKRAVEGRRGAVRGAQNAAAAGAQRKQVVWQREVDAAAIRTGMPERAAAQMSSSVLPMSFGPACPATRWLTARAPVARA